MELQVQIDDVYQCPGMCPGCVISKNDRKSSVASLISPSNLPQYVSSISEYTTTLEGLDVVNLTYGIGDHLSCDTATFKNLIIAGSNIAALGSNIGTIGITMAMIGKTNDVVAKLKSFKASIPDISNVVPIIVIDPLKIENKAFKETYLSNIEAAKDIFLKLEFVVNLSSTSVSIMSPSELYGLCESFGIEELTINFSPNVHNQKHTTSNLKSISNWLIDLDIIVRKRMESTLPFIDFGYRHVMESTLDSVTKSNFKSNTEALTSFYPTTIHHSILLDHHGHVFPKLEAIGDVSYSEHFNYTPIMTINNKPIADILSYYVASMPPSIVRTYSVEPCRSCVFSNECITTGFHVYNQLLPATGQSSCPHIAYDIFNHYNKQI